MINRYQQMILALLLFSLAMPPLSSSREQTLSTGDNSAPTNTSLSPNTARPGEMMVPEPVFNSAAFITQAGLENNMTVVLVHGMGDRAARDWERVIPELAKKYHVIAFDLPGFGRSSKGNNLYSPAQYAAFIKWVVDQYARKPFVLIGHSMGGALALKYASLYPEHLHRLILVDAAAILHHVALGKELYMMDDSPKGPSKRSPMRTKDRDGIVRSLLDSLSNDERANQLEQALNNSSLRQVVLGGDPKKISGTALMLEDFGRTVNDVHTPILLIWGEHDKIAPLRTARALVGVLPEARLEIIPQTGHTPMLERPEAFNRIVLEEIASRQTLTASVQNGQRVSESAVRFDGKKNFSISGHYKTIELNRCTNARLIDVTAEQIIINNSTAIIENSRIRGRQVGLKVKKSEIVATNFKIDADTAIHASRSRLDFAGADLAAKTALVTTDNRAFLVFSISRAQSPNYTGSLHGARRVTVRKPL
jgi:pimeloyl-ACP methyl ester carboxylesterase